MKGDKIEVIYAVGDSAVNTTFEVVMAGGRIEARNTSRHVSIVVSDRNGNDRQTATFAATAVIAVIERPKQP